VTARFAALGLAALGWSALVLPNEASAQAQAQPDRVPVVAVVGCVTGKGSTWLLANATEPEPSIANAPPSSQPYKGPTSGKNQFQLIGISEFDLPSHQGHTVLVKGLFIKAAPASRINVTSVTMVSTTCAPPPK
jgi:hypothetical protein